MSETVLWRVGPFYVLDGVFGVPPLGLAMARAVASCGIVGGREYAAP